MELVHTQSDSGDTGTIALLVFDDRKVVCVTGRRDGQLDNGFRRVYGKFYKEYLGKSENDVGKKIT